MTTQTEAQRLADALKKTLTGKDPGLHIELCNKAIDELRRLEAANAELVGVMKAFSGYVLDEQNTTDGAVTYSTTAINHWAFLARAAIAKHGGAA